MFHPDSYCGELWSQIEITPFGEYKICCLANFDTDFGLALDKDGKPMSIYTHSIQEAMNSETHKEHRRQYRENIKVQRCRNCYDAEESTVKQQWKNKDGTISKYGKSKRQRVNDITSKDIPEYITWDKADQYTAEDGSITSNVVNLGLRLGNVCNQKCIMCRPEHSNQWYDDWVALYGYGASVLRPSASIKTHTIQKNEKGKNELPIDTWWESDIWWQRFTEIAPNLRHIYFTGGEPLISKGMKDILLYLIEKDFAKNVILRYDTNLTAINNQIIDNFKHFRRIDFCVSLDDTDEKYELIRFPGKFNNIVENIKTVKNNGLNIHYLSCCVGIASVYSVERVTALAEQLGVRAEFRFLEGPHWLDLRALPRGAKEEIIKVYQGFESHSPARKRWYNSVIKFLEKYIDHSNQSNVREFVTTMDKLDTLRGTDWRTSIADVHDLLKRHCPYLGL